jgi:hypothetical protein
MSLTEKLEQFESMISTQLDSMTESDLRQCNSTMHSIQSIINDRLQEIELLELAFL